MAKRRCFSVDVFEKDVFLNMSANSRILYVYFILHSDDDGVIINPQTVMRLIRARDKNLDELLEKGFVVCVDDVYVIKHWYMHNKVQPSRKIDSLYQEQLNSLYVDNSKVYQQKPPCRQIDDLI